MMTSAHSIYRSEGRIVIEDYAELDVNNIDDLIRQLEIFKGRYGNVDIKVNVWDYATQSMVRDVVDSFYDSEAGEVVIY